MTRRLLQPGQEAPQFKAKALKNGQFETVELSDYAGKYLVLLFYPYDFSFVCPTELLAFSDRAHEFRETECEVLAISTDSHFAHFAWSSTPQNKGGLGPVDMPMVADKSMEITKSYGILKSDEGCAFRGLFILDGKQKIRQVTVNDIPVGRDVDETLRLVKAFQFTDEFGEVCPANWRPGKKAIDTKKKDALAEYLSSKD